MAKCLMVRTIRETQVRHSERSRRMTAGSFFNPTVMLGKSDKHFFIFIHGIFGGYRKGATTLFIPDDYPEPSASLSFADKIIYPMDPKRNKLSFPEYAQNYFLMISPMYIIFSLPCNEKEDCHFRRQFTAPQMAVIIHLFYRPTRATYAAYSAMNLVISVTKVFMLHSS